MTGRVDVTETAAALLREMTAVHGPLMFHQSGGCCDGSSPMCYPVGMFRTGAVDVLLDTLDVVGLDAPVEVYMSRSQFEYWKFTHLTIDVVQGRGSGFSVEALEQFGAGGVAVARVGLDPSALLADQERDDLVLGPVGGTDLALLRLRLDLAHLAGEDRDDGRVVVVARRGPSGVRAAR